jgi:hypothetical protein
MQSAEWLEELEPRTHLSATLSRRGVLYVVGTHRNDVISVSLQHRHRGVIVVNVNHQISTFATSKVRSIIVQGGRGNDRITISDHYGHVGGRHYLYGGAGSDYICGDSTSDYIVGGDAYEDDIIAGGDGIPVPSTPTTNPSDGNSDSGSDSGGNSGGDSGDFGGSSSGSSDSGSNDSGSNDGGSDDSGSDYGSTGGDFGDSGDTSSDDSSTGGDF